ncbi:MAG: hypothetical protein R6U27_16265, partial [Desulfobacterales bacterium]
LEFDVVVAAVAVEIRDIEVVEGLPLVEVHVPPVHDLIAAGGKANGGHPQSDDPVADVPGALLSVGTDDVFRSAVLAVVNNYCIVRTIL